MLLLAQAATEAAAKEAASEIAAGGVQLKGDTDRSSALTIRGEDVMTQVTHGVVCLGRLRPALCDHAANLGYVGKIVGLLGKATGKASRFGLATCAVRVLQVIGARPSCVKTMASHNVVSVVIRSIMPLHRDAAFTLETLLTMLKTGACARRRGWYSARRGAWAGLL